jgi:signal transduction histidine kinase
VLFVLTAAASASVAIASSLGIDQIVIRSLLLALATAATAIFAVERDRIFDGLTGSATAPVSDWADLDAALFALLGRAADLASGSRVALVWADPDEPWTNVAVLDDELTVTHIAPAAEDDEQIEGDDSFICGRLADHDSVVTLLTASGLITVRGAPLPAALNEVLAPAPRSIVGVAAHGQVFAGHLLILDWKKLPPDFVLRAEIVGRQIAASLDDWLLSRRSAELAAREERARVWRDLHDGVLQSLTGLALMLAQAEQSVDADPSEARRILQRAGTLVHDEQRDLRLSILEQKAAASSPDVIPDLPAIAAQLASRFEQVWNLQVDVSIDGGVTLSPSLTVQLARMIQEALSNSARHGQSSRASLCVAEHDQELRVVIEDNGRGFPFVGTFTHNELLEKRLGPILLKDRVQRLHGTLSIRSAPTGVRLDIRIPLRAGRLAV